MASNIGIPKGTRDFSPAEMVRRNYIFDTIRSVFQLYGYQPIETPSMENLTTLLGKYGVEGDKLIFKILNSGNFLENIDITDKPAAKLSAEICEKGLRYDLTVPFARYVVQHRNEITFPFKRYQIQPVWRADRPQKGRYREFFQCDVDVIGSKSLVNELELIQIIDEVFKRLKIDITIKINNRKILTGIAELIGEADKVTDITVAIDKLDKIGIEKVNEELRSKGLSDKAINDIQPIINLQGTNPEKLNELNTIFVDSNSGKKGVEELFSVMSYLNDIKLNAAFEVDLTLARGLNYYTGAIFEVKANNVSIGSICGGGRYDDLTGIFGMPDVSGVGVSFGADRIYDVLNELNMFPESVQATSKVLFVNFGGNEEKHSLKLLSELRLKSIPSEIYPDVAKMKKQFDFANAKNIPYVAVIGQDEMQNNEINLKNMSTGEQNKLNYSEFIDFFSNNL
jgi:histidyl-tRNA synthetase